MEKKRKREENEESDGEGDKIKIHKKFQCDMCSVTFSLKRNLVRHVLSHNTFYECELCGSKFKRKYSLQNHRTRKHNQKGDGMRNNLPTYTPSTATTSSHLDHDYAQQPVAERKTSEQSHDNVVNNDHTYVQQPSASSNNIHHRTSTQTSINGHIQDRKIEPNGNEQYDMLTLLANVRPAVKKFIHSRLSLIGIKWYISIQVELVKLLDETIINRPHFRSRTYTTLNIQTFDEHELNESIQKMFESFEKYIRESSGWVLKKVLHVTIHSVSYSPISGSSYLELPKPLRRLQSLLNIRNVDQKCFLWSCLASIHPSESPLVTEYEQYEHELNMKNIDYPVTINEIDKFEKQNPRIAINVFGYEDGEILPLRITKQKDVLHYVHLLLIHSESNQHFVLIKNFNKFLSYTKGNNNYFHFCPYCLHGFQTENLLNNHLPYCQVHGEQKVELPSRKDSLLEFNAYEKTLRVPYVIYADFETLNKPIECVTSTLTTQIQHLEACSFGYKIVSTDPNYQKDTIIYRGADASQKLLECLLKESNDIEKRLKDVKPLNLTHIEELSFQKADKCYLCQKLFIDTDKKARHHDHTSGKYIGATHTNCNLQCKQVNFIPVIFHNLKNFDAHLLCNSIGLFKNYRISCIPQSMEKYVSFSLGKLRFIDSFGFLPSSLSTLVDNLAQDGAQTFTHFKSEVKENIKLLLCKGTYPYEYMDSWNKFNETRLPHKSQFYSSLTNEHISDEEYKHAKSVFSICGCKTLGDYHDLYLKTDVLLLADVFEQFRNTTLKSFSLDPAHFYTTPGLSWQAMLKMTGVTLELMTNIDHILFIERAIRGGVSQISNRYAQANNPYLKNYNPTKENSYIAYYDVNNLYGHSMSQPLPTGLFTFLSEEELTTFDVTKIAEEGSKGYIVEVDLEYPIELHDSHNDFPLAPVRESIPNERISLYAEKLLKKLYNTDVLPPRVKVEKLLTTLENKQNYVVHYRTLQLYIQLGLKVKKIHKVLEFEQQPFMKPYIEFNTKMRQQAKSTFEKNLYKLYNNSCFGKTMEQVRKHKSVELCHTEKRLKKLSAKSTYKSHRIFSEDLVGVEMTRVKVKLNKPIYVGMSVLDLSKHTMYNFFYNHLKKLYQNRVSLLMTDTDSFLIKCQTQDIFQDMYAFAHLFDTSDFPKDHFLQSNTNKKVLGKLKSETNEKCISEFCGLRSKMYAFSCEGKDDKRAKGISKSVVKKDLTLQHYIDTLFDESKVQSEMNILRSHNHEIYCENVKKTGLSCYDDKRWLCDAVSSLSYGHYKIQQLLA